MISVDPFLDRESTSHYSCFDLASEFWQALTGEDAKARLNAFADAIHSKRITRTVAQSFEELSEPVSPCFIFMQRPGVKPHIGVFYNGRILHLSSPNAEYMPVEIATRAFTSWRFYK